MKFLIIFMCLFSERYLIHSISFQRFTWFGAYSQKIIGAFSTKNPSSNTWFLLIAMVAPVCLGFALVFWLFHGWFFGAVGFVLSLLVFMYCLGPQNAFYPLTETTSESGVKQHVGDYFAAVNTQIFSVIFWFVLTGPVGLLTYRVISLCQEVSPVAKSAQDLTNLLEWIPARITALLYLLVGNFQHALPSFKHYVQSKPSENHHLLSECGLNALYTSEKDNLSMSLAENLVEMATVLLLVLIALGTLVSWL